MNDLKPLSLHVDDYLKKNASVSQIMKEMPSVSALTYELASLFDDNLEETIINVLKSVKWTNSIKEITEYMLNVSANLEFNDSLSAMINEFEDITTQFEEILESPEVPKELHSNITALKESINSMDDSEIKNELTRMSNQFKVIETTTETNEDSSPTIVFPTEFMNSIQIMNENLIKLSNKIEANPTSSESIKLRKTLRKLFITLITFIVGAFLTGYIGAFAVDCYNTSHVHKEMSQQVSSPLDTNQSSPNVKSKSDLVPNNQSNHNE